PPPPPPPIVPLEGAGVRCREARIALGSVGVTPLRATSAEALLRGEAFGEGRLRARGGGGKAGGGSVGRPPGAAGRAAKTAVAPLSDHRGSAVYKREMTAVMVGRALEQAWGVARRS